MPRMLLAVAAALVVLSGCGSADEDLNLAAAVDNTQAAGSSRIAVDAVEIDEGKRAEITCRGEADYMADRLAVACDYGRSDRLEWIAIGEATYLRGDIFGVPGSPATYVTFTGDGNSLASQLSPRRLLDLLRAASQEMRRVGEEEVRGVETVHYELEVDCAQAELADCDGATAPVEVWIGADELVHRIWLENASTTGTIEFYDFGVEVDVQPPPADQVEELQDPVPTAEPCTADFGEPIRLGRVVSAMREAGLSIQPGILLCQSGTASFGNTGSDSFGSEGHVFCFLRDVAPSGAPSTVRRRGADGADVELTLENLECTLFADSTDSEPKIDRLEAAFADVERQIRQ